MAPPKHTKAQKAISETKRKAYQKDYQSRIPIELRRIYRKSSKANSIKQVLKK